MPPRLNISSGHAAKQYANMRIPCCVRSIVRAFTTWTCDASARNSTPDDPQTILLCNKEKRCIYREPCQNACSYHTRDHVWISKSYTWACLCLRLSTCLSTNLTQPSMTCVSFHTNTQSSYDNQHFENYRCHFRHGSANAAQRPFRSRQTHTHTHTHTHTDTKSHTKTHLQMQKGTRTRNTKEALPELNTYTLINVHLREHIRTKGNKE